jgi:hypothetical protein
VPSADLYRLIDQFNDYGFDAMAPVSPHSDSRSPSSSPVLRAVPRSMSAGRMSVRSEASVGKRSVGSRVDMNRSVELLYSLGAAREEKLR